VILPFWILDFRFRNTKELTILDFGLPIFDWFKIRKEPMKLNDFTDCRISIFDRQS